MALPGFRDDDALPRRENLDPPERKLPTLETLELRCGHTRRDHSPCGYLFRPTDGDMDVFMDLEVPDSIGWYCPRCGEMNVREKGEDYE
jgi:rubredoxin